MIPGAIEGANYKLFGNGADVYDLHAIAEREGNMVAFTTAWLPTPAELAALAAGAPVYVTQLVIDGVPPLRVEVKDES